MSEEGRSRKVLLVDGTEAARLCGLSRGGWRAHHLISRTSSRLRPRLLLEGRPVLEVDVANSQPLLLSILAARTTYEADAQHIEQMHDIMEGAGAGLALLPPASPAVAVSVSTRDAEAFRELCESGLLYDELAADCGIQREQAKKALFRDVLFGKPYVNGKITQAFGRRWPTLLAWIRCMKKTHGYKSLAMALQRLESVIMLDGVGNRVLQKLPSVPFLTIHDSAMLMADHASDVRTIMLDEFSRWGVRPDVRLKGRPVEMPADSRASAPAG